MMKTKPRDMDDILREEGADAARAFRDSARLYERKSDGPFDEAYESGNGDANRKRFRLERFKDIKASTAPAYLIKGIIPRTGIVVIWGPPKCGKTFDTHDKVMHIAAGWPYRGRRVKQGPIVYVAAEGATGLRARTEAWRQHHLPYDPERDEHDVPFYMIDAQINLAPDADKLIAAIKDDLGSTVPAAVVLDTLNRTIDGSESKDEDMGRFLRAGDMIQRAFNCVVIVVHHMYMLIIWSFVSFPANSVIAAAPNVTTISGFGNLAGCTAAANSLAGNNGQTTGFGGGQLSVIAGCILVRSGQN